MSDASRPADASNVPAEVREHVVSELARELVPVLPANIAERAEVAERVASVAFDRLGSTFTLEETESTFSMIHSGPMPSVMTAQGYEKLYPGSIQRMFGMAERDQEAHILSVNERNRRNDRFRILSLSAGFVALIVIVGMAYAAAMNSHDGVAIAMLAIGAGGIVATLVGAPSIVPGRNRTPPERPAEPPTPPARVADPSQVAPDAAGR